MTCLFERARITAFFVRTWRSQLALGAAGRPRGLSFANMPDMPGVRRRRFARCAAAAWSAPRRLAVPAAPSRPSPMLRRSLRRRIPRRRPSRATPPAGHGRRPPPLLRPGGPIPRAHQQCQPELHALCRTTLPGEFFDEANYGQIVRRAPRRRRVPSASLSKQLPNSRINLMSIDATRDASPLPLLQTIDWSVKIDALVVTRANLDGQIVRARRAGLVAPRARDHAWVGFPGVRCSSLPTLREHRPAGARGRTCGGSTPSPKPGAPRPRMHAVRRHVAAPKHSQLPARRYRISVVHGCVSILSSDCRPPKSPPL